MYVMITKANSANLWYNDKVSKVYQVVAETPTAYYVKIRVNHPVPIDWVYKKDCEVL